MEQPGEYAFLGPGATRRQAGTCGSWGSAGTAVVTGWRHVDGTPQPALPGMRVQEHDVDAGTRSAIGSAPRLGLVCITASQAVRYRTVTRKRLLDLGPADQRRMLERLYADNLERLDGALEFCAARGIALYRLPSSLFPFADGPLGEAVMASLRESMERVGRRAAALGMRLVLHPDQFVVLNSDSPGVVATSVTILATQARILDLLVQPRSPWAAIQIHGGKRGEGDRLVRAVGALPEAVRSRLSLENDEYAYGAAEILAVCRAAGVPMVFDAHHHVIHEGLDSYDHPSIGEMFAAARTTWPAAEWQLVHISNGRESFTDRRHSDLVLEIPAAFRHAPWIEVEAKLKEAAIERLQQDPAFSPRPP